MTIKKLNRNEIEMALPLVWKVFCGYEAANYTDAGKKMFYQAIHSDSYLDMLTAYGAYSEDELVGVIATRNNGEHIALFFVDGKCHRQGIGRQLFDTVLESSDSSRITVNSSEYAVEVYKRLGFHETDGLKVKDGIRFVPMVFERHKREAG
jgi:Acetyltransferase (GNAT) family.